MGDDTKQAGEGLNESSRSSNGSGETPPALRVIGAFGGIRPMANKLNVPVSTVQGWKERGVIPETRHDEIRTAAKARPTLRSWPQLQSGLVRRRWMKTHR